MAQGHLSLVPARLEGQGYDGLDALGRFLHPGVLDLAAGSVSLRMDTRSVSIAG